ELYGLHISPDLDTVMYTLAGMVNGATGWGVHEDTFDCLDMLGRYGEDTWFQLGDRDLATHIRRTHLLRQGLSLSEVTWRLSDALGVRVRLLPMSNEAVRTEIVTADGVLAFQDYFVRRRQEDEVRAVRFIGVEAARPSPGVIEEIETSDTVLIAPSNPFVSVGPILAIEGICPILQRRRDRVVAISPIIGGATVKGPADRMLRSMGHESSALGVARIYQDVVGTLVIDELDADLAPSIRALGMQVVVAQTLMTDLAAKRRLAEIALLSV
ncbi:MAG: domain protein containing protein, partial [Chloroflexi bacterium]|nr:domain protein containing protein [Chloroflexota bacterium]